MAKRKFRPNFIQLCLTILLVFSFGWSVYKIIATQKIVRNLRNEVTRINGTIESLQKQQKAVEGEIARWNDPAVIEEFARKELGLVKPGEITYMFSEMVQPNTDTEVTKRSGASSEGIGN